MKEIIKNQWKNIAIILFYIVIANCVYIILFERLFRHVWVDILTGVIITLIGLVIGHFYITSEYKKECEKNE